MATVCHFLLFRGFTVLYGSGPIRANPHFGPLGDLQDEPENHPFGSKNGDPFFIFFCKILSLYWFLIPMDGIGKALKKCHFFLIF